MEKRKEAKGHENMSWGGGFPSFHRGLMDFKDIIYEPGRVTRIILNRPRYKNACSHPEICEMENAFEAAHWNTECRVIVLSGMGDCFTGGDDVIGFSPESAPMLAGREDPLDFRLTGAELMEKYNGDEKKIWELYTREHTWFIRNLPMLKLRIIPKPTIAMVHGCAIYMGYNLAHAMDMIFTTEDTMFMIPEPAGRWGLFDVPWRRLLEIQFEHRGITTQEMYHYNVVNRIFPDFETLERETLAFANRVADYTPMIDLAGMSHSVQKDGVLHNLDMAGQTLAYLTNVNYINPAHHGMTPEEERHPERYGGRGMAQGRIAFRNLATRIEQMGQALGPDGKEMAPYQQGLLQRAEARAQEDKDRWQASVHQEWRSQHRKELADKQKEARKKIQKDYTTRV